MEMEYVLFCFPSGYFWSFYFQILRDFYAPGWKRARCFHLICCRTLLSLNRVISINALTYKHPTVPDHALLEGSAQNRKQQYKRMQFQVKRSCCPLEVGVNEKDIETNRKQIM